MRHPNPISPSALAIDGTGPAGAGGVSVSVDTIAALAAVSAVDATVAVVRGYHAPGDLGGGTFHFVAGSILPVDNVLVFAGGGMAGRWLRLDQGPIHVRAAGMQDETQSTSDQVPALTAFFAAVAASGRPGRINAGTYKCLSKLTMDLSAVETTGLTIEGDSFQRSVLDFTGCATAPNVLLTGSAPPENDFYVRLAGFSIVGNIAGSVLQVGLESFADPLNEAEFDLYVANYSASAAAVAVEVNFVCNSELRFIANCGGNGTAILCNRAQFCDFFGSYGNSNIAFHLAGSYNFGNTGHSLDLETCNYCLQVDVGSDISTTFIGGQWNYNIAGVNAVAGSVMIINPNPAPQAPATVAGFLTGAALAAGTVEVVGPNINLSSTPAMPASGAGVANACGQTVTAEVWGGTVQSYAVNGGAARTVSAGQAFSVALRPGDKLALTYTAAPTWLWRRG